jgi:uncharacterized protein YjbI with pentapeptide repeats
MGEVSLKQQAWEKLVTGETLDGLPLAMKDGRVDLTGLVLQPPPVVRRFRFRETSIKELKQTPLRGIVLRNLDLSGSTLPALKVFGCEVENCVFADCRFDGLRLWSTNFRNCSFRGADLEGAVLGGVEHEEPCRYEGVDFSAADLRRTIYKAAAFEKCLFRDTKLVGVDFKGCTFVECNFQCELRDVIFSRHGFKGDHFPPNEMVNVDFTGSTLRDVGFRGLALNRVKFPKDDDHIVIRDFSRSMDRMRTVFIEQGDELGQLLARFIDIHRKWSVPDQLQGVINLLDLTEVAGEEGKQRFLAAIPSTK